MFQVIYSKKFEVQYRRCQIHWIPSQTCLTIVQGLFVTSPESGKTFTRTYFKICRWSERWQINYIPSSRHQIHWMQCTRSIHKQYYNGAPPMAYILFYLMYCVCISNLIYPSPSNLFLCCSSPSALYSCIGLIFHCLPSHILSSF